jgi:hypothetical protein
MFALAIWSHVMVFLLCPLTNVHHRAAKNHRFTYTPPPPWLAQTKTQQKVQPAAKCLTCAALPTGAEYDFLFYF